ncbi:MAG: NADH:flavin oxidoreductase, partial [Spirochaetes bacterium]
MKNLFNSFNLAGTKLVNRFVFPPIKTAFGSPDGVITDRQLAFYNRIASQGPGLIIVEPVAVTQSGREHPKQLKIDRSDSPAQLRKITDIIHSKGRHACLHLNHAGAAANPKATGSATKAPSPVTCPTSGQTAEELKKFEIADIISAYKSASVTAAKADFDFIEIQGGHGYLLSQFLNGKINKRTDAYGLDRLLFAREVFNAVKEGAPDMPLILRISGSEMSPEFGVTREEINLLIELAQNAGFTALHVSMGSACFNPPWYYHHASLPEMPQIEALEWVRSQTNLPIIAAGRMGRKEKLERVVVQGTADMAALGRPLLADPDFIEKLKNEQLNEIMYCGYCLQGCLHNVKNGRPIGCNLNPELDMPLFKKLKPTESPLKVLVAGGGPAGLSAAKYQKERGHRVVLAEKSKQLGGQYSMGCQVPGKEAMEAGLETFEHYAETQIDSLMLETEASLELVNRAKPDLFVWAGGAVQNIPQIKGMEHQYVITSLEYFKETKKVKGKRILVIGAGRIGLEITEKLGLLNYQVTATKRTDPIGSTMEMITKKLILKRIGEMHNVTVSPHTTVKEFKRDSVEIEKDGKIIQWEPFDTVILASGLRPASGLPQGIKSAVQNVEIIGDA